MSDPTPSLAAYVPPDIRVVNVRTNLVPGYVSQRMQPRIPFPTGKTYALAHCSARLRNLSDSDLVVKLQETDNEVSGARVHLAAAKIVPNGAATLVFTPTRQIFEVKGVAGNGPVWLEIVTKMDWNEVGSNQERDAYQAQVSYAADPASPSKSASQTFTSATTWVVVHNLGFIATPTLIDSTNKDITAQGTISNATVNGYTVTFTAAKAGIAYSTL